MALYRNPLDSGLRSIRIDDRLFLYRSVSSLGGRLLTSRYPLRPHLSGLLGPISASSGPSILAYLSGSAKATLLSPIFLRLRISARCARLSFLRALLRVSFDQCLVSASSMIFFSRITYSLRTWAAQVPTHRWQHRRSGIEIRISSSSLLQPHHR